MNILGIGPLEFLFILVIAIIILGPKDMVKAGQTIGRWLRKLIMSETWRTVQNTSRELRNIPTRLIRESGMDEIQKDLPSMNEVSKAGGLPELSAQSKQIQSNLTDWTTPNPNSQPTAGQTIAPPPQPTRPASSGAAPEKTTQPAKQSDLDWTTPRPRPVKPEPSPTDETVIAPGNENAPASPPVSQTPETKTTES